MTGGPPAAEWILRGNRIALDDGIHPAAIRVAGERITGVTSPRDIPTGLPIVDAGNALVFPGLVDTHVHVNEPGRTEWEGFATATRAAAAGGVTTLLDMPLNAIPATTSLESLAAKQRAAEGKCAVDVGFLGGVVPGNQPALAALHDAGVFGFKCFLCPSGVEEFGHVTPDDLLPAVRILAPLGALLMAHAELPSVLEGATTPSGSPRRHATWLASRPVAAETEAVRLLADLARRNGTRVHVVHVSAAETISLVESARSAGVALTAETCPHYLAFAAEEVPDGATEYKCAPPIRASHERDGLWAALDRGGFIGVVSDHSPAPPVMKARGSGDFFQAWGGIASLQLRLPVMWTEARRRGFPPERLIRWLCTGPAELVELQSRKGLIAPGRDADFVIWHDAEEWVVTPESLRHRHPLTPWLGRRLAGKVEATYLRGALAYHHTMPDGPVRGRLLRRDDP